MAVVLGLLWGASSVHAQSWHEAGDPFNDRFRIDLGTFIVNTSTTIQVNGAGGRGTEFDTEHELGFHDSDRFRADAYWRFFKRHKLRLMYFDTDRHASKAIDREIQFRDTTFPVSAQLDSRFLTRVAELAYEYSFVRTDRFEVDAAVGIHNLKFQLDLSGSAMAGMQQRSASQSASVQADGPLPVVGLHGIWKLSPRFYLDAQAQFFKISISPYDGRLEDYNASAVWQFLRHVGVGAGYNEFITKLDVSSSSFNGSLRWRYGGMRLFVNASF
jgi:hypothetical protein